MTAAVLHQAETLPELQTASAAELHLMEALDSGRAALPLLPTIAAEALQLAADPDASVAEFAELVKTDPPIAVRFIALANSSYYTRGQPTKRVQDAVARLGLAASRDLIFQLVYSSQYQGLRRFSALVERTFTESVQCAVVCRTAAGVLRVGIADAYLCGLLHDVGQARVFQILSKSKHACEEEEAWELAARYHARAGAELARHWALPDELVQVCRRHHDADPPALHQVQLVRLAELLMPVLRAKVALPSTRIELPKAPAELGVEPHEVEQIFRRSLAALGRLC